MAVVQRRLRGGGAIVTTLGQEFAEFVADILRTDGDFGSTMTWRHITSVENASTGDVTQTPSDETFRGGVADPVRLKVFSDAAVAQASTAVVVPAGALTPPPKMEDKVSLIPGQFMLVIETKDIFGPGDAGPPVLIAHVAAVVR